MTYKAIAIAVAIFLNNSLGAMKSPTPMHPINLEDCWIDIKVKHGLSLQQQGAREKIKIRRQQKMMWRMWQMYKDSEIASPTTSPTLEEEKK